MELTNRQIEWLEYIAEESSVAVYFHEGLATMESLVELGLVKKLDSERPESFNTYCLKTPEEIISDKVNRSRRMRS